MSFKDNLLKKIHLDTLARTVKASIGPPESGRKLHKEAMKDLLEEAGYRYLQERDLDLYIRGEGPEQTVVVLDNELPIYRTTVADVAMRKSPTVKEMVNIRNAIKILNDKDVKTSRKMDSLGVVHDHALAGLDLSFTEADLREIAQDGVDSLQNTYAEGILEALSLFSELLGYTAGPGFLNLPHCTISGAYQTSADGVKQFGPFVVYDRIKSRLLLFEETVTASQKDRLEEIQQVHKGEKAPSREGAEVFASLVRAVMEQRPDQQG